jgi:hypothetical protein
MKPDVGHSIIAYDITNSGGGLYYLWIYDNNYPNDTTRRMKVNTAANHWQYADYKSASGHEFRYLDSSIVLSALQAALQKRGQARLSSAKGTTDMYIAIPTGSEITYNGASISEIPEAPNVTPLTGEESQTAVWFIPQAVYGVSVSEAGQNGKVVMFDSNSSFSAEATKGASLAVLRAKTALSR